MQNTVPAGAKTGKLSKLKSVGLVLLVVLAAAAMLGLPAFGNALPDNAAGRYARVVVDAGAPKAAAATSGDVLLANSSDNGSSFDCWYRHRGATTWYKINDGDWAYVKRSDTFRCDSSFTLTAWLAAPSGTLTGGKLYTFGSTSVNSNLATARDV